MAPHLTSITGYVYIADQDSDRAMAAARPGARVSLGDRRPPWIVVDHTLGSIIVAKWPGKLWRVSIADPVTDHDEQLTGVGQPHPGTPYTRAVAVDVIEEVASPVLFGPCGEAVCSIIAQAGQLEAEQVSALAKARHPGAPDRYSGVWNRWLAARDVAPLDGKLDGTLKVPGAGSQSPINCGFAVLWQAMRNRAESLIGPSAFTMDEEDGVMCLEPTWSEASSAMLDSAMAFGAPQLLEDQDWLILTAAWRAVIGHDPI